MRNRFFADADLHEGATVTLDSDERHHARVLRVRDGEEVEVFDGRGGSFRGVFEGPERIRLIVATERREPERIVHLAMAIIQLDRFEFVLQKATELGAASVIPMVTERCEVRPERYRGKAERWQKILFEATKQSGGARVPLLESPSTVGEVIVRPGAKIVFDADETPSAAAAGGAATLLIGPEGGWSPEEMARARQAGCTFRQLGLRRLRAETAAIVATAFAVLAKVID